MTTPSVIVMNTRYKPMVLYYNYKCTNCHGSSQLHINILESETRLFLLHTPISMALMSCVVTTSTNKGLVQHSITVVDSLTE